MPVPKKWEFFFFFRSHSFVAPGSPSEDRTEERPGQSTGNGTIGTDEGEMRGRSWK